MAEIEVQKKKPSPWPWIIGLLVIALVVWGIAEMVGDDEPDLAETDVTEEVATPPAAVPAEPEPSADAGSDAAFDQYSQFAQGFATAEMGREHELTADGIEQMIPALMVVARDMDVTDRLEELRQSVQRLRESPADAASHAGTVESAFDEIAGLLEEARERAGEAAAAAEAQVQQVREAADAFQADRPLLDQRETVQRFFTAADQALRALHQPAPASY